jgi:predicted nucleic acid-binding protein
LNKCLLDTDVIIQWLRGIRGIKDKIESFISDGVSLIWTPVQITEIFAGVREGEEDTIKNLFFVFDSFFITEDIGIKAGEYLRRYGRSHSLEIADALTAASASYYKLALWTLNVKHYPMKDVKFVKM